MNDAISIQTCQVTDVPELSDLFTALLTEQLDYEPCFAPGAGWDEGSVAFIEKVLASDNYFVDVLKAGTRLIGFHLYGYSDEPLFVLSRQGYIADLYIIPEYRKQGLGVKLAQHGIDHLRSIGTDYIQLNVLLKNVEAFKFWHSVGFKDQMARMKMDLSEQANSLSGEVECGD